MYAAFFGLSQPPFSIAPDPHYLFMSERHREALAHLLYGVESGGGFVLLTGEIGAGKTTVCRRLLEETPKRSRVAYIFNPKLTVGDLLHTICHEFGVTVPASNRGPLTINDYLDPLNAHLIRCHAQGLNSVIIIDEAQSLSAAVLEQLRLMTNLETRDRKLLQIILIGQPELRQMLARPELEQLNQRVIARFHLGALSETESREYVAHRLSVAGWTGSSPFTSKAMSQVYRLTGGVPRRINLLCDRAMLGAYATGRKTIDHNIVNRAAREVFDLKVIGPGRSATPLEAASWWKGLAVGLAGGALILWAGITIFRPGFAIAPPVQVPEPSSSQGPQPATPPARAPGVSKQVPAEVPARSTEMPTQTTKSLVQLPPGPPPREHWFNREDEGFVALGNLWGLALEANDPCLAARQHGLQCYRTPRMTVNGLRQLDRPALLKLQMNGRKPGYVLATAISDTAIEMRAGDQSWRMPLSTLSSIWKGYYASLWRTPPGQRGRMNNAYQGSTAQWLDQQLSSLQNQGAIPDGAHTLKEKVEAFQRANGIETNGVAGPTTLMLINRATNADGPRLSRTGP